jgi:nucleoside-diphosphate-sugar epimerase
MRVLIVGCGYVGMAVGERLVEAGHEVLGLRRSQSADAALRSVGIEPVQGDVTQPVEVQRWVSEVDAVVNAVSSGRGGATTYRDVYLGGVRNLLAAIRSTGRQRLVHLSSTSVYGQTDGSWVGELALTEPTTETGAWLVATERELVEAAVQGWPVVCLRVSGIYGPERGHLFRQLLQGEARVMGDGGRWLNMVHRDDVASAVVAALSAAGASTVYNVTDDEPVTQADFLGWLCAATGLPYPPTATPEALAGRKRGVTDKRVSNARLRSELGWVPRYPTFREGYRPLLQAAGYRG